MAINTGATLVLKAGNFFANVKSATSAMGGLKSALGGGTSALKVHGKEAVSVGSSLKSLAGKVVGVVAAYASVSAIKTFGSECLTAANTAAEANTRLNTIMAQIPGNTDAMTESVRSYASELSKVTTIGGSAQKYGASQLASFQMSAESIKTLMPQLNNLAVAQYGVNVSSDQMVAAANMLGKAYAGQTGAMTRAGIVMSAEQANLIKTGNESVKTATLVQVLQQNFGNLAKEMAKTPEGALIRVRNSVGALKTKIGTELQPVMTSALNYIADNMPTVEKAVVRGINALRPTVTWITSTALPAIGSAIGSVINKGQQIYNKISPSLSKLGGALKNLGSTVFNTFDSNGIATFADIASSAISKVSTGIAGVTNVLSFMIEHWKAVLAVVLPVITPLVAAIGLYKTAVAVCNVYDTIRNGLITANIVLLGKNKRSLKDVTNTELIHNIASKTAIAQYRLQASVILASVKSRIVSAAASVKETAALGLNKIALLAHSAASAVALGATKALAAGQALLNAAFVATPIGWIVLGIGAIAAAFAVLWNKSEGFRNFWKGLWSGVKGVISAAKDTISEKLNNIKTAYIEHGGGIKGVVFGAMEAVKGYYTAGFTFIDKLTGGRLSTVVNTVKNKASEIWNGVKESVGGALDGMKNYASDKLNNIKTAYEEHGGGIKGIAAAAMESVKSYYTAGYDALNTLTGGKLGEVTASAQSKLTEFGNAISVKWESVKSITSTKWQSIKNTVTKKVSEVWDSVSGVFENIKTKVSSVFEGVKSIISNAIEKIKGFFKFKWELPKIKLPHFSIKGEFSLNPPSIPTIGVDWYAKGGIMTRPTIFGMNGARAMAGGEAGAEAVLPLKPFWDRLDKIFSRTGGAQPPNVRIDGINVYITGDNRPVDELAEDVVNAIVPKLKARLANL